MKVAKTARCAIWTHRFGWELRLLVAGEPVMTHVCRSQTEVLDTAECWKAAMRDKGWQPVQQEEPTP